MTFAAGPATNPGMPAPEVPSASPLLGTPAASPSGDESLALRAGEHAALLSAVEVGLGSLLHALNVPLAGHALSLNQGFVLTLAARRERAGGAPAAARAATLASQVAALLKSLSPAGRKLTPMLAISAQGLLYALGIRLLGAGAAGVSLGMALLSLWGFAQPVAIGYLLYGSSLFEAAFGVWKQLAPVLGLAPRSWVAIVLAAVALKALLGIALGIAALRARPAQVSGYLDALARRRALRPASPAPAPSPARGALRDLLSPVFLGSYALVAAFFAFSESARAQSVWFWMRPLAAGYALFWLARRLPLGRIAERLRGRSPELAVALERALDSHAPGAPGAPAAGAPAHSRTAGPSAGAAAPAGAGTDGATR